MCNSLKKLLCSTFPPLLARDIIITENKQVIQLMINLASSYSGVKPLKNVDIAGTSVNANFPETLILYIKTNASSI